MEEPVVSPVDSISLGLPISWVFFRILFLRALRIRNKLALKKLADLNTQLEDELTKRVEEINLLKSDNAQLQKDNDHLTSVVQ